jgi:hypothetical protein
MGMKELSPKAQEACHLYRTANKSKGQSPKERRRESRQEPTLYEEEKAGLRVWALF